MHRSNFYRKTHLFILWQIGRFKRFEDAVFIDGKNGLIHVRILLGREEKYRFEWIVQSR